MIKFWVSIKKEYFQVINDKVGIILMFLLPLLLVLIITIVQDSAFKVVNENKISILVINQDKGQQGMKLISFIEESSMFNLEVDNDIDEKDVKKKLLDGNRHTALLIPEDFSLKLHTNASKISHLMTIDLGLTDSATDQDSLVKYSPLNFYYDPVLQDNYIYSLIGVIYSFLDAIESTLIIENVYSEMGIENKPEKLKEIILSNKIRIEKIAATTDNHNVIPNSTQHNVPAWTIFAMFFMVISLGGNIVRERINGSFIRLKTMPTNFSIVLISKMVIYLIVAILQVTLIFSVGVFIFPFINLPQLVLPSNMLLLIIIVFICSFAAISYALMIGSIAKTQEQSNGFGAVTVIIFAALGGVWVPIFVMPDYMQTLSNFSPLHWCLESFYVLFLKGGNWSDLNKTILPLAGFIISCQLITFYKLRIEKII
ncbi:ABC transporter permease [candidate division KSB1 bacterium]